ncbi:MAG: hypothetical protein CHACPFDD_01047 [Phycisphaerae bacterium]|nr:hypothetical protein [Phycisphaerae bacterium]
MFHHTHLKTVLTAVALLALAFTAARDDERTSALQPDAFDDSVPDGLELTLLPDEWLDAGARSVLLGHRAEAADSQTSRIGVCRGLDVMLAAEEWYDVPGGRIAPLAAPISQQLLATEPFNELLLLDDAQLVLFVPAPDIEQPEAASDGRVDELAPPSESLPDVTVETPDVSGQELTFLPAAALQPGDLAFLLDEQLAPDAEAAAQLAVFSGETLQAGRWYDAPGGVLRLVEPGVAEWFALARGFAESVPGNAQFAIYLPVSDVSAVVQSATTAGDEPPAAPAAPAEPAEAPTRPELTLLPAELSSLAQLPPHERFGFIRGVGDLTLQASMAVPGGSIRALDDASAANLLAFLGDDVTLPADGTLVTFTPAEFGQPADPADEAAADPADLSPPEPTDEPQQADDGEISGTELTFLGADLLTPADRMALIDCVADLGDELRNAQLAVARSSEPLPMGQWHEIPGGRVMRLIPEAADVLATLIDPAAFEIPEFATLVIYVPAEIESNPANEPARELDEPFSPPGEDSKTDPELLTISPDAQAAFERLQHAYPDVAAFVWGARVSRVYGAHFGSGPTPEQAAEQFVLNYADAFGADPVDLAPGNHFNDQRTQPVMYDPATETYRFTLVYFAQQHLGIPVYKAELRVLVLNEADYPVVWAGSTLRDLSGLQVPTGLPGVDPADTGHAAALARVPGLVRYSPSSYVIWAGTEDQSVAPRLAVVFDAANALDIDYADQLWRFVADARTGEILHSEERIRRDVTGNVKCKRTEGFRPDACAAESSVNMPYARIFIFPQTAFANKGGDYKIWAVGPWNVTVESNVAGRYFYVTDHQGDNENLTKSVPTDGVADFVHNADNDSARIRAQVNGYYHAHQARQFVLAHNPNYPTIKSQQDFPVHVNRDDEYCPCNAWYNPGFLGLGASVNFCRSGGGCFNTAFAGIIYHEYGHHVVAMGGSGQGQYGEGFGDCMELVNADDAGHAYGDGGDCNVPNRDADNDMQHPCNGEIHYCGQLLSGCLWSIRNELIITEPADYQAILADLLINSVLLHDGENITPQICIDFLTLDDTDGKLWNCTPHRDEIVAGFKAHNMDRSCSPDPGKPTSVAATDGTYCDKIRVTWTAGSNTTGYAIYRSTTNNSDTATEIGSDTASPYDDATATPGSTYYYWVKGKNCCGRSAFSTSNSGNRSTPPAAPTGVSASDRTSCTYVLVSWNAVSGATSYSIWRKPSGGSFAQLGTDTASPYTDSTATPGTTYYYAVKAVKSCGSSDLSAADTGARDAPPASGAANVGASKTHCAYVRVTWDAVANTTSYLIFRNTSTSTTGATQVGTDTASPFDDTTATPGTIYYYWVKAKNTCGTSGFGDRSGMGFRLSVPAVPSGVAASDAAYCDRVRVSWSAATNATGYTVWRNTTTSTSSAVQIGSDTESPFDDLHANAGTTYYYWVKATNDCGSSGFSNRDSGTRAAGPATPTGVAATDATLCDKVRVTWSAAAGATGYTIWRSTTNNSASATQIGSVTASPFDDLTATPGTTYYYWVKSTNNCGSSAFSTSNAGSRSQPPAAPTGVAASDGAYCSYVRVSWNAVSGATGYTIWRNTVNDVATATQIGTDTASPYDNTTAVVGTAYFYWVKATKSCGSSGFSSSDSGYRATVPSAPTAVSASDGTDCTAVVVSWGAASGATSYTIYRNTVNNSAGATKVGTSPASPFYNTTATAGTTYYFWVKATNACGSSGFSNGDSGFRAAMPAVPGGVAASDGTYCGFVRVTWNAAANATGYTIWRNTSSTPTGKTFIQVGSDPASPFDDLSADPGTTYYYWVRATNGCGSSALSTANSGYRAKLPAPPTNVKASDGLYYKIRVTWNASAGATGYSIWRSMVNNPATATQIGTDTASPYDDTTMLPFVTYYYWVKATNACGASDFSNGDSGISLSEG